MPEDKGLTRSEREEKVLQFWKDNQIFEKTLLKKPTKGEFIFYEGPPTANGRPGLHHIEARAFKDAIPRYKTMQGFHVPRKAGWDTHGLPVELEVEKNLGLKSKKEIESYGIAEFNKKCKESVGKYIEEWERFTDRVGYWVNSKEAYFTYDNSYISSVWSIIAEVEKKKLLYKDYKVVPWCPRCGTGLSSHELAQGYETVKDLSVYVKLEIKDFPNAYFLAWTTTPWTLAGNVALAVGADITYVEIKVGEEILVLAKERLAVVTETYEIIAEHKGSEMAGMSYEPLYPFLKESNPGGLENAYKIYTAPFVTTEDGTGIVHTAVMYGQEDFELGTKAKLPKHHFVDETGLFKKGTGFLEGKSVVEEETAVEIIKDLAHRGLLYKKEKYEHSYPFCWRCKTRLIYYARDSWYIRMSDLREDLVKENKKINWEPNYIKEGRFGEWLREVKDWAISRERYWGTPMPIWINTDGTQRIVVDSIETLKKYARTSGNKYFVLRHGQAENNVKRIVSTRDLNIHKLSEVGQGQIKTAGEKLKHENIDVIIASPFLRTRESAEIVASILGLDKEKIIYDDRLKEFSAGNFETKGEDELHAYFAANDLFLAGCEGGESFSELQRRLGEALSELEEKYKGKNILIVTHKMCAWLLTSAGQRLNKEESNALDIYLNNGAFYKLDVTGLPHNENFVLDLHKPYIDEIVLEKDGEEYRRVREVMDVWLDSGSMPFAQDSKNIKYPADFISEAIDQTRGWFYTLHAVGVLMGKGRAFKNAICLGHILDKEGKKMSKSVGNVVDPWKAMEKYGVDTLRLWMYSVNQPGESKNFDERSVEDIQKRLFNLVDNVYSFYELYRDKSLETQSLKLKGNHILDKWILARLDELINLSTSRLDQYQLLEPVRAMRDFVDDFSTWYLRRSRDRIKDGDTEAKQTLYYVLKEFSKLLAPFAPFAAEDLYQKLRTSEDSESVHLCQWPGSRDNPHARLIENMNRTRSLVSEALEARFKAGIKIRQPLSSVTLKLDGAYAELIKEEVNVKEVKEKETEGVDLDTHITPELEEEGKLRDVIRSIQDMRKEKGLKPSDTMSYTPENDKEFYKKHQKTIESLTNIKVLY
ncbi:MAG: class I tRNA ligase family protein [Parcubacteria group bacterium]